MKACFGTLLLCAALFGAPPAAAAAVLYQTDDGGGELPAGGGPPIPADFWWAQSFTVVPGGNLITELQVAFGSTLPGNQVGINGLPVKLLLYDDSDDNGNPNDGLVLLQEVNTTTAFANTDTFISEAIPPTAVSGVFFVAALMQDTGFTVAQGLAPAGLPAAFDQSSSAGTSWSAENTSGGAIDPNNVVGTSTFGPVSMDSINAPGNFLLRATGVPEPTALSLLLLGSSLAGWRRRRR